MIFISAGHHFQEPKPDPGAVATHDGKQYKEAELAADLEERVCRILDSKGVRFITDRDEETLGQYIKRIKPGSGSVVLEIHFNSVSRPDATGTETIVKTAASTHEWDMAKEISDNTAKILGIANRGVKTEQQSHRGRLAILNTGAGVSALTEVCFISNRNDIIKYLANIDKIAALYADVLIKYENKFV